MPKNPFNEGGDPLAPEGGAWGAGAGAGGFGASNNRAADYEVEEYSVVDIDPAGGAPAKAAAAAGTNGNSKSVAARQKELDKREADLKRREAAVKQQEDALRRTGAPNALAIKNWPPCMPIVHNDISNDIPEGKRGIPGDTRRGLLIFMLTAIALIWNFISVITAWILDAAGDKAGAAFFLSAIYALIGIPLGWLLWYKRLYRAMMYDGAITFATFFLVFMIHIGFAVWNAVAPPIGGNDLSHAGIMSGLKMLDRDETLAFIFYMVGFALWTLVAVMSFGYLFRVYAAFRGVGGVEQARREVVRSGVEMVEADVAAEFGGRRK